MFVAGQIEPRNADALAAPTALSLPLCVFHPLTPQRRGDGPVHHPAVFVAARDMRRYGVLPVADEAARANEHPIGPTGDDEGAPPSDQGGGEHALFGIGRSEVSLELAEVRDDFGERLEDFHDSASRRTSAPACQHRLHDVLTELRVRWQDHISAVLVEK